MVSAINSAVSGLNAASTKLAVSANNIANQFSTKTDNNGQITDQAYTPQQAVSISQANGGVTTVTENEYPSAQGAGSGNGQANVPQGNDITQDLVNTNIASYDFQANLKTIQVANETLQSFLDIIS